MDLFILFIYLLADSPLTAITSSACISLEALDLDLNFVKLKRRNFEKLHLPPDRC